MSRAAPVHFTTRIEMKLDDYHADAEFQDPRAVLRALKVAYQDLQSIYNIAQDEKLKNLAKASMEEIEVITLGELNDD